MRKVSQIIDIFLEFARDYPLEFLLLFGTLCIEGVVAAGAVLTMAPLVDYLLDPSLHSPSRITQIMVEIVDNYGIEPGFFLFAGFFIITNLIKGGLDIGTRYTILRIKYRVMRGLTSGTLNLFLQARWSFFSGTDQGKLLNTFNRELVTVGDTLGHLTTQFAQLIQLSIYLVVPLWLSPLMTLSAVGLAVALAIPFLFLHRLSYRLGQLNTTTSNEAMGVLSESLGMARLILGYARQSQTLARYLEAFDRHVWATLRSQTLAVVIPALFQPIGVAAGVMGIGIALSQGLPISEMAAILWSLLRAIPVLGSLLQTNVSISNFLPSYEQLVFLRDQAQTEHDLQGAKEFKTLELGMSLRNVDFSYPGRAKTLQHVSLELPKNRMIALVGESGSGKSTITDLLLGLQIPDRGEVLLDGTPLSEWKQNSFRERVGYVPQDPQLFNCSIRENLLWSFERSSESELWDACQLANAEEFIRKLPMGLDTVVGDRGIRLSGGQRQRVALARALIRKPYLLVLDEATSSLDSESERLIQTSIENLFGKTTLLVVAHRLSTVASADCIYVLSAGQVMESGSYTELNAQQNSIFAKMVRMQQVDV